MARLEESRVKFSDNSEGHLSRFWSGSGGGHGSFTRGDIS